MKEVKIGKDVIESLTLGMYEDSRFIYREYIQNAVDQIDKAVEVGLLKSRTEGTVFINIDRENGSILIEDNATGIESVRVEEILGNIALSEKDRSKDKGFRGIGRLGGLGYCKKLIFETSIKGESIKSTMVWDALELKKIINDRSQKEEATEVIRKITTFSTSPEDINSHYFKVILKKVENSDLLDKALVREYLSMVAPLPFESHFVFKSIIKEQLNKVNLDFDEYRIFINTEQLYKGYTSSIYDKTGQKKDDIFDISCKTLSLNDKLLAFIWYGISKVIEQIPSNNISRGFRLRKGNIQIGDEYTLRRFFTRDQRFHFYFVGEIHVFDHNLIPNARRDYFLENKECLHLESELRRFFSNELHALPHTASNLKSSLKKIEGFNEIQQKIDEKKKTYFSSPEEKEELEREFVQKKSRAENALKEIEKLKSKVDDNKDLKKIFNKVVSENEGTINNTSKITQANESENNSKPEYRANKMLPKLNKHERKLVSRVYRVLDSKLTPEMSENLKYWIEEEFK